MPIWVTLALVGVLGLALWGAKASYDSGQQDIGAARVQKLWDAAVIAQKKQEALAAAEADDFQRRADAARNAAFKQQLARREAELLARLSAQPISSDVVGELRNTVRTANRDSANKPAESAATPAGPTDGRALTEWFATVGEYYRACRETVIAWIAWDDRRMAK